jgi:UDP-glucose 4-epimerase
MVADRIST